LICTIIIGGILGEFLDLSVTIEYAIMLAGIQLSPLLGLLLLSILTKDFRYFKQLQWCVTSNKFKWLLLSILIHVTIISLAALILSVIGQPYIVSDYNFVAIIIIVIGSIIGCLGEDIGWRGFLLPAFQKKHSLLISAIFTGILWGAWHLGKIELYGISGYLLFILLITNFSILMSWIYYKTGRNIIIMIIFHLAINMVSLFMLTNREGVLFYIIASIIGGVFCLAIVLKNREDFLRKVS